MADNKNPNPWPNVQFQNIHQQKPPSNIGAELLRFVVWGFLILGALRLAHLLAG